MTLSRHPSSSLPSGTGLRPPGARLQIARRQGSDLEPLNVTDPGTVSACSPMSGLIRRTAWPALRPQSISQPRTRPRLDRVEAAEWTERTIDLAPEAGMTRVLMHAVAMQYAGQETRERIRAHAERVGGHATAQAPFAWLRFEADAEFDNQGSLRLTLWPGGTEEVLAIGDTHGEHLRWIR